MADIDRYQILASRTKAEFPRFHVKLRKKSWLHPLFWVLSKVLRMDYSTFTTTIFSGMYTRDSWESRPSELKYRTLRHEKTHIKQFHCWPLGRWAWPLNHLIMGFCYIFIFPFFLTFRAKFEREGYTQSMLVKFELYGPFSAREMESEARWLAKTFGTSTYGWMWTKKKAYAWAMDTMRKINASEITNDADRVDELRAA